MEVTEATIRLVEPFPPLDKDGPVAFINIVLNHELAIKGIRLVRVRGKLLASMPNKERQRDCYQCHSKNDITNKYCHNCGNPLERYNSTERVFLDIVHPVNSKLRDYIEQRLIKGYEEIINVRRTPPSS
jgi:DNA-binding cell septation regulator SpoVG